MKELQNILQAYESLRNTAATLALATVVKVRGSTYRRPGARMLMSDDGRMVGTVSGGCLEADVLEKARKLMLAGKAETAVYDMTSNDEGAWGLSMGCNGVVHLLVEPLTNESAAHLRFLRDCLAQRVRCVVAVVFRVDGEFRAFVGMRLMVREDGSVVENVMNPVLAAVLLESARQALEDGKSEVKEYRFGEGVVEALVEVVDPPTPLIIFGAGYDAIPVARLAGELGWNVTVVDHRPAFLAAERFPDAKLVQLRPEEIGQSLSIDRHTAVVVMTHNFEHDLHLLKSLLPSPAQYVGLLGPRKRTELLLEKLRDQGVTPTEAQLARLHAPIGLDLGAESPEAIALAILAEIQATLAGRRGGYLRDLRGPIH
jgi:xanthine dehydrogenase accessory factor